jgi:hypothetical protein
MIPLDPQRLSDEERRSTTSLSRELPPAQHAAFTDALKALNAAAIPYVIEGAFLLYELTGVWRPTKDLDVFVPPELARATLAVLEGAGFSTLVADPAWIGKAYRDGCLIDVVFGAGNRHVKVDSLWHRRAFVGEIGGVPAFFCPPEEAIAFKAFVVERHRFDGHDVVHLIEGTRGLIDWDHLLWRMGDDWELLLWHLLLFRYIYPLHAHYVPRDVLSRLVSRLHDALEPAAMPRVAFRGALLAPFSYNADLLRGFPDPRLDPSLAPPPAPAQQP